MFDLFGAHLREGDRIGVSEWKHISQDRIDLFARVTDDFQFFHVDPVRAARETPFQGTIAHGFLILSLVNTLACEAFPSSGNLKSAVIVSVDRVRFAAPVRTDRRIQGRFYFKRSTRYAGDNVLVRAIAEINSEGDEKPALSGEFTWLCTLHSPAEAQRPLQVAMAM